MKPALAALAGLLLTTGCGSSEIPGPIAVSTPHRDIPELVTTTTTSTTTTTVRVRGRVGRAKPRPTRPKTEVVRGDIWRLLANCESPNGRDSASGKHHGYFQFSLATWRSIGEIGDPHTYSYEHQRAAAIRLQARSGWGQWPSCSARLGLRP